jgi:osmoprotectant transport system substrate-binding protein
MQQGYRSSMRILVLGGLLLALGLGIGGCGSTSKSQTPVAGTASAKKTALPGTGKPTVTIGDKNFTEQFLLGQLYRLALQADGFSVNLNPNIGPTEVTLQALGSGRLDMYPEYLSTWNQTIAGYRHGFRSEYTAYQAAQRYALAHGMELLNPTPFSDSSAIAVNFNYGAENDLNSIADLSKVAGTLTVGAPPQFQQDPHGLPAIEQAYGFIPAGFKALDVGAQYQALDQGAVQAADVSTTDGELISGNYTVLKDPKNVFGWGNVVPVVATRVVDAEGPAFVTVINKVSALLTTDVIRQLNAAVDISHQSPQKVAKEFLLAHGLLPATQG